MNKKANDLGREVMARSAEELEQAAAAVETEADLLRQAAQLFREGRALEAMRMHEMLTPLNKKAEDHLDKFDEKIRMLEIADKVFFEELKKLDTERRVGNLSADQARIGLIAHEMQCREGKDCDVHKALTARIKRG